MQAKRTRPASGPGTTPAQPMNAGHSLTVIAGYHLGAAGGKALSIVVVENDDAVRAMAEALAQRAPEQRVGIDPDTVEFFEAQPF